MAVGWFSALRQRRLKYQDSKLRTQLSKRWYCFIVCALSQCTQWNTTFQRCMPRNHSLRQWTHSHGIGVLKWQAAARWVRPPAGYDVMIYLSWFCRFSRCSDAYCYQLRYELYRHAKLWTLNHKPQESQVAGQRAIPELFISAFWLALSRRAGRR